MAIILLRSVATNRSGPPLTSTSSCRRSWAAWASWVSLPSCPCRSLRRLAPREWTPAADCKR